MTTEVTDIRDDIIDKQPKDRLIKWLKFSLYIASVLALAGLVHWLTDKTNSQTELKEMMQVGFNKIGTEITGIKTDISSINNHISDIKTEQSEQKQFNKVVKNELTLQGKLQAAQIEEIYNQMKRDQSPMDRKASREESYIQIEPIKSELQSSVPDPIFKKKLSL